MATAACGVAGVLPAQCDLFFVLSPRCRNNDRLHAIPKPMDASLSKQLRAHRARNQEAHDASKCAGAPGRTQHLSWQVNLYGTLQQQCSFAEYKLVQQSIICSRAGSCDHVTAHALRGRTAALAKDTGISISHSLLHVNFNDIAARRPCSQHTRVEDHQPLCLWPAGTQHGMALALNAVHRHIAAHTAHAISRPEPKDGSSSSM